MTSYERGANFERKVKRILELQGMFVVRSAGSHGPVDLVGLGESNVYLIQCKSERFRERRENELGALLNLSRAFRYAIPILVDKPKFGVVRFIDLRDGKELEF